MALYCKVLVCFIDQAGGPPPGHPDKADKWSSKRAHSLNSFNAWLRMLSENHKPCQFSVLRQPGGSSARSRTKCLTNEFRWSELALRLEFCTRILAANLL